MEERKQIKAELKKLDKDVDSYRERTKGDAGVGEYLDTHELNTLIAECIKYDLPISLDDVQSARGLLKFNGVAEALEHMKGAMERSLSETNATTADKQDRVSANPTPVVTAQNVPVVPARRQPAVASSDEENERAQLKQQSQKLLAAVSADIERAVRTYTHERWNKEFHMGGREDVQNFASLSELRDECSNKLPKLNDIESLKALNKGLSEVRGLLLANKKFNTSSALETMQKTMTEMEKSMPAIEKNADAAKREPPAQFRSHFREETAKKTETKMEEIDRRIGAMKERAESVPNNKTLLNKINTVERWAKEQVKNPDANPKLVDKILTQTEKKCDDAVRAAPSKK